MRVNRRKFLQTTGLSLGAVSLTDLLPAEVEGQSSQRSYRSAEFPAGFLWGAATASYQVEGAVHEGGRGVSIWDTFSRISGKTFNGETGDVADDFYHLYRSDIQLMKDLGLKTFRFSVAWTRIFPNGTGAPNQAGVDFYNRLIDALLAAGIQPYCTLFHWDLPQALQDTGGWENRDTAKAFADYAGYTAGVLSDRVTHFMTMNEMRSFTELGYRQGIHAPGLKLDAKRFSQLNHNVLLAHGMSVQAIRARARGGTKVGIADNVEATTPIIESPEHIEAARRAMREENAMYLTAVQEGRYTDLYLKRLGADAPKFTSEEMTIIKSPLDFVGLNIYQPTYVRADESEKGYALIDPPASYPHMSSPWLYVGPEALYWAPKLASELWNIHELYISENGASSSDEIASDSHIYDSDRVMYLRSYLSQLHRAVDEGIPIRGYFLWSLLDNFEWAEGYSKRFGIVYVDFSTQKRIPKMSADFYQKVIRDNCVR
jgi:beta-glucosidase